MDEIQWRAAIGRLRDKMGASAPAQNEMKLGLLMKGQGIVNGIGGNVSHGLVGLTRVTIGGRSLAMDVEVLFDVEEIQAVYPSKN